MNIFKEVGKIAASFIPGLGPIINGPLGSAALDLVADTLGVENEPETILSALKNDPEAAIKMQGITNTHIERLQELENAAKEINNDSDKIFLAGVENARLRDLELKKAGHKNIKGDVLAYAAISAFIAVIFTIIFVTLPNDSDRILFMLLGVLTAIVKDVYQFEFGSSKGSKDKDSKL